MVESYNSCTSQGLIDKDRLIPGLEGADLGLARLSCAEGVAKVHLAQAECLEAATMPNQQKCEDRLNDREGRKDEKNG